MKLAVQKNHLGGQCLCRSSGPPKNGVFTIFLQERRTAASSEPSVAGWRFRPDPRTVIIIFFLFLILFVFN